MTNTEDSREKRLAHRREWTRKWLAANREKVNAQGRAWRAANREKQKEAIRKWTERNSARFAFLQQRVQAKRRNIQFLLTFEEWKSIWAASGKWDQRGHRKGQYVMARYGDGGPYAVDNVHICTVRENWEEAHSERRGRPLSTETRERMSAAQQARRAREAAHGGRTL